MRVNAVTKTYDRTPGKALDGMSFALSAGETLGVVGESGSGKSTLARIAMGLLARDDGEVLLAGRPWSADNERDRRPRRQLIKLIHQNPYAAFVSCGRLAIGC